MNGDISALQGHSKNPPLRGFYVNRARLYSTEPIFNARRVLPELK